MASSCGKEAEPGLFAKQVQGRGRLHSKLLSKEAAAQLAAPSFRVYYSVASAGAVPFLWESQPGTPKNDDPSSAGPMLPPLTPPPSYYAAGGGGGGAGRSKERRRGSVFQRLTFLRRRPPRHHQTTPTPCYSSSSSSWSTTSSSSSAMSPVFTAVQSPSTPGPRGRRSLRRTFSAGADEDDTDAPCFGMVEPECCERGIVKGCSVVGAVRTVLAAVVGGKSAGRRA